MTQIVGLEVAGTAQSLLCQKLGHEVFGVDKQHFRSHLYCTLIDRPQRVCVIGVGDCGS